MSALLIKSLIAMLCTEWEHPAVTVILYSPPRTGRNDSLEIFSEMLSIRFTNENKNNFLVKFLFVHSHSDINALKE